MNQERWYFWKRAKEKDAKVEDGPEVETLPQPLIDPSPFLITAFYR